MRVLTSDNPRIVNGQTVDDAQLNELYAFPDGGCLRTNFVATLDGAAAGPDGRSGSINNAVDKAVFDLNRRLADVVVAGVTTMDIERYHPSAGDTPLVTLSGRCRIPRGWWQHPIQPGMAIMATTTDADPVELDRARELLGPDSVWTLGAGLVDLAALRARLEGMGLRKILCEGGPRVHADLLRRGLLDEAALTWTPTMVGGPAPRIVDGDVVDVRFRLRSLLESDATLLGLWAR